jgi:hypothetical protein
MNEIGVRSFDGMILTGVKLKNLLLVLLGQVLCFYSYFTALPPMLYNLTTDSIIK